MMVGATRGAPTPRIDSLAAEGFQLLNFAPETQCTPSRSAPMTGRYSIRSGNQTVALAGSTGGLVAWERTMADILSDAGYATSIVGKWHIGASKGRWPTDHGFDEWIGIPHSYDEALWASDPWYDPKRDPVAYVLESTKGKEPTRLERLTVDIKLNLDVEYMRRAKDFIGRSVAAKKPFFLYFNHTLMHLPVDTRKQFKGRTGRGPWADSLVELDSDFGELLDYLKEKGVAKNTIIVFSGDNGPEEMEPWRGDPGRWDGSYFTGMEGHPPSFVIRGSFRPGRSQTRSCILPTCSPRLYAGRAHGYRTTASSTGQISVLSSRGKPIIRPAKDSRTGWVVACTASNGTISKWSPYCRRHLPHRIGSWQRPILSISMSIPRNGSHTIILGPTAG
jgi:arylsulfatase A-like enzyme